MKTQDGQVVVTAVEENNMERLQNLIDSLREVESTLEGRAALQSMSWSECDW